MPAYDTKQHAVDALLPGAKIVGEQDYNVKVSNPKAGLSNEPATIDQKQGTTLSIQNPDGTPDTIVISDAKPVDSGGGKGGIGYEVIQGPQKAPTKTSTPASGLERLDANLQPIPAGSSTPTVYVRDPKAPPGTSPFKVEAGTELGDPSTWTPIKNPNDPNETIGLFDPQSKKVAASVSAPPNAKPSGVYTNLIDPNDPAGKRVIGMVDTGDKSVHSVATAPDNTQIVATPTAIYTLDKTTGAVVNKQDLADNVNKQAVTLGSKVYTFDPKDGTFTLPTNVQAAATVGNSTTLKDLVWYDDQGNEVGDRPNPNYGKAPVTAPTPNTVAPMIQVPDPKDPSQLVWIENKGQVVASEALKQLASHLSGQVIDGKISVDEAKALIDASNAKMTNDINKQNADTSKATQIGTAAGDVLRNAASNAQTGAGLLQNRVTTATGSLNSILGSVAGSNIMSAPAGIGARLVGGLTNWVTGLGGGDATYDAAARMVQAADPKIAQDPTLANQAQQTLAAMLKQYQAQTGQEHPIVAATTAANQSVQNGGMAAPSTYNPNDLQWTQKTGTPGDVAGRTVGPGGVILGPNGQPATPAFQAPVTAQPAAVAPMIPTPGLYNPWYQQQYPSAVGAISTGPNASNGFVAPIAA